MLLVIVECPLLELSEEVSHDASGEWSWLPWSDLWYLEEVCFDGRVRIFKSILIIVAQISVIEINILMVVDGCN